MGSKYGVKSFLKSFVNFPAWMGASTLRRNAKDIVAMSRELFSLKNRGSQGPTETFHEAAARFNLSEADLIQRQRAFGRLAAVYLFLVLCLGVYAGYLLYRHAYLSVIMTFVLMLVAASFAFKEHFWYVQMRHRRLGLTVKDWFFFVIGKTKVDKLHE